MVEGPSYGLSMFSMIFLGLVALFVVGGLILKITSRSSNDRSEGQRTGRGAIILGIVLSAILGLGVVVAVSDPPLRVKFRVQPKTEASIFYGPQLVLGLPITTRPEDSTVLRLATRDAKRAILDEFRSQGFSATYQSLATSGGEFPSEVAKVVVDRGGIADPLLFVVVHLASGSFAAPLRFRFDPSADFDVTKLSFEMQSMPDGEWFGQNWAYYTYNFEVVPRTSPPVWIDSAEGAQYLEQ